MLDIYCSSVVYQHIDQTQSEMLETFNCVIPGLF